MRKGTYIGYHVIMVCLAQKRKRRQQQSIDKLLAQAQAGGTYTDKFEAYKKEKVSSKKQLELC